MHTVGVACWSPPPLPHLDDPHLYRSHSQGIGRFKLFCQSLPIKGNNGWLVRLYLGTYLRVSWTDLRWANDSRHWLVYELIAGFSFVFSVFGCAALPDASFGRVYCPSKSSIIASSKPSSGFPWAKHGQTDEETAKNYLKSVRN